MDGLKTCRKCKLVLPADQFGRHHINSQGHWRSRRDCNKCRTRDAKRWREEHPDQYHATGKAYYWALKNRDPQAMKERSADHGLRCRLGIGLAERKAIVDAQGGNCALCGEALPNSRRNAVVDHCHNTGKIRGVIHKKCNTALGYFKDNADVLRLAIAYLERAHVG